MRIPTMLAASLLAATAALTGAGTAVADDSGFKVVSIDDLSLLGCGAPPIIPILASIDAPLAPPADCSEGR
jgi:hypothetical protein